MEIVTSFANNNIVAYKMPLITRFRDFLSLFMSGSIHLDLSFCKLCVKCNADSDKHQGLTSLITLKRKSLCYKGEIS